MTGGAELKPGNAELMSGGVEPLSRCQTNPNTITSQVKKPEGHGSMKKGYLRNDRG